jgi:hypothetical protein
VHSPIKSGKQTAGSGKARVKSASAGVPGSISSAVADEVSPFCCREGLLGPWGVVARTGRTGALGRSCPDGAY